MFNFEVNSSYLFTLLLKEVQEKRLKTMEKITLNEVITIPSASPSPVELKPKSISSAISKKVDPSSAFRPTRKISSNVQFVLMSRNFSELLERESEPFEVVIGKIKTKWSVILRKSKDYEDKVAIFLVKKSESCGAYNVRARLTFIIGDNDSPVVIASRTLHKVKAEEWFSKRGFEDFLDYSESQTRGRKTSSQTYKILVDVRLTADVCQTCFEEQQPKKPTKKGFFIFFIMLIILFLELIWLHLPHDSGTTESKEVKRWYNWNL